jgi:hypothetical protein
MEETQERELSGPMSEYALGKLDPETLLERIEELTGRCLWAADADRPELRAQLDRTTAAARKRKLVCWAR